MNKTVIIQALIVFLTSSSWAQSLVCAGQFQSPTPIFDTQKRAKTVQELQRQAQLWGAVTAVIDRKDVPVGWDQMRLQQIFGTNVFITGKRPPNPRKIKGLVLHIGDADYLKEFVVGDINLLKGWGNLHEKLDNKVFEYKWAIETDPSIMPRSIAFDLIRRHIMGNERNRGIYKKIEKIVAQMIYNNKFQFLDSDRKFLVLYFSTIIDLVHLYFPSGAVIKHAREFQSGDGGGKVILSNKFLPKDMADRFIESFYQIREQILKPGSHRQHLSFKDLDENRLDANFDKHWILLQTMVFGQFKELMAQEIVPIKKEIRLDTARGLVINMVDRYDGDWRPSATFDKARELVETFFKKMPYPYNMLSAGVDVAELADGRLVIIDFNFGAFSSFIDPLAIPVSGNMYISNILGQPTPLLVDISKAGTLPQPERLNYLKSLDQKYFEGLKNRDEHLSDMIRYLGMKNLISEAEEKELILSL